MILHVKELPNAKAADFKKLNDIEHAWVRIGERKKGFSCSVAMWNSAEARYDKAKSFKVMHVSFMGKLYAKVTQYIKNKLEEINRATAAEMFVIEGDVEKTVDLVDWYHQYLLGSEPSRKTKQAAQKTNKMKDLAHYVEHFDTEAHVRAGVVEWIKDFHLRLLRNGQPITDTTKRTALNDMKGFLKKVFAHEKVAFHVQLNARDLAVIKESFEKTSRDEDSTNVQPFFLISEVRKLLAVDDRFVFPMAMFAYTGMRKQEVYNLRWENIINDKYIHITKTKRGKKRDVRIMPELSELIQAYRKEGHAYEGTDLRGKEYDDFLFDKVLRTKGDSSHTKDFKRVFRKSGVSVHNADKQQSYDAAYQRALDRGENTRSVARPQKRSYAAFRRTFASCMALTLVNGSEVALRLSMGHTKDEMTDTYSQYQLFMDEVTEENWPAGQLCFMNPSRA